VPEKFSAGQFVTWFVVFTGLLALGTVFIGQALWFVVPVIAGKGCVSGGICGGMAPVIGLWLQPLLLLGAVLAGTFAFYRRGLALGSRLWALLPVALLAPNLPALLVLASPWGVDVSADLLVFPRWSLFELTPLLALGVLLCFDVEHLPGFGGSIAWTRLYRSIPIGPLYIVTSIWICSGLILTLSAHLGIPAATLHSIRGILHFPVSLAGGVVYAGLPPGTGRPDLVVSLATLINLIVFLVLVYALAFDGSGRARRAGARMAFDQADGDHRR
tara:strand:+ start:2184 stop:3002 length:819 start_codon:yes stop_codon:yes gene_type:complete